MRDLKVYDEGIIVLDQFVQINDFCQKELQTLTERKRNGPLEKERKEALTKKIFSTYKGLIEKKG